MSPAIEAAMATTAPIDSAATLPVSSVQPSATKMRLVPSSVAMVIPEVGFDVTPTSPTMRLDTVTKKKAKIATSSAPSTRTENDSMNPKTCGATARNRTTVSTPIPTKLSGRSSSVRLIAAPTVVASRRARSPRSPSLNEVMIIGVERSSVVIPAVATAPAPT